MTINQALEQHDYTHHGERYVRPGGKSASVTVKDNRSFHHSSNDPLSDGYWHRPFDVFCHYDHGGDCRAAVKEAATILGLDESFVAAQSARRREWSMGGDTVIKLEWGWSNRGKFPVRLMCENVVLLTGQVNPYKPNEIDEFVTQACEALPGITEWPDELRAELLQLAAPEAKTDEPPALLSADNHPYAETMGGIVWKKSVGEGEVPIPLTNFTARIVADVVRDDGAEKETAFEIEAVQRGCTQIFMIPAGRFNAMTWPAEHLGAEAVVFAGQAVRDHARAAIQLLSPKPIPKRTIFTHTGWRKRDGGWAYLHSAGAIGPSGRMDGVQVDLPGPLALYELPDPLPQGNELQGLIRTALGILDLAPDAIILPAFCVPWRAVMATCDFGLHFAGPTGVFKSELAALIQQYFGPGLDARHLPGSWHSTDNALEGLLFAAKDALTVVDDFAPCGGPHDVARWHQRADRIIRAQGNNAGRGRMRADGSLRPAKPPRGLVLSTGEDIPKGQSLRARMLILEITKGDILPDVLTRCQQDARSGAYAAVMAGFVQYLASRYEQIRQTLRPMWNPCDTRPLTATRIAVSRKLWRTWPLACATLTSSPRKSGR